MNDFRVFRALGLSFKAWFVNFIPFTLIAAVLYAPVIWWVVTVDLTKARSLEDVVDKGFTYPFYGLFALSALVAPLLTYRVIQDLNGTRVSIWTSIQFGFRGILPAIILAVISFVLGQIPFGSIASAILTCFWFVATPAAVGERLGPFAALSRSAELTSGRRWGIFGMTFLMGLVLVGILMLWFVPKLNAINSGESPEVLLAEIRHGVIVFICIFGAYQLLLGITQAVSYALLRQDKEGVSNEELARIFD